MKQRILPILRVAAWVFVLLLCILPVLFSATPAGYLPLTVFLFFSLFSLLYFIILQRNLEWEDTGGSFACTRGDELDFGMKMLNRGIFVYPYVKVKMSLSSVLAGMDSQTETVLTLAPREERNIGLDVGFLHLGEYTVSVDEVKLRGLMGVLTHRIPGGAKHLVTVKPRIWNIEKLTLDERVMIEDSRSHTSSNLDGMDYVGVRDYEIGDPMKNIHWNLSAHTLNYMTKQRETVGTSGITVILDLYTAGKDHDTRLEMYDALVEGAVAVCNYAIEHNIDNDITFFDRSGDQAMREYRKKEDLEQVLFDLPGITNEKKDYPVEKLLEHASKGMYVKNNVVLVSSDANSESIRDLIRIRDMRRLPMMLYVVPSTLSPEELDEYMVPLRELTAANIPWYAYSVPNVLEGRKI